MTFVFIYLIISAKTDCVNSHATLKEGVQNQPMVLVMNWYRIQAMIIVILMVMCVIAIGVNVL